MKVDSQRLSKGKNTNNHKTSKNDRVEKNKMLTHKKRCFKIIIFIAVLIIGLTAAVMTSSMWFSTVVVLLGYEVVITAGMAALLVKWGLVGGGVALGLFLMSVLVYTCVKRTKLVPDDAKLEQKQKQKQKQNPIVLNTPKTAVSSSENKENNSLVEKMISLSESSRNSNNHELLQSKNRTEFNNKESLLSNENVNNQQLSDTSSSSNDMKEGKEKEFSIKNDEILNAEECNEKDFIMPPHTPKEMLRSYEAIYNQEVANFIDIIKKVDNNVQKASLQDYYAYFYCCSVDAFMACVDEVQCFIQGKDFDYYRRFLDKKCRGCSIEALGKTTELINTVYEVVAEKSKTFKINTQFLKDIQKKYGLNVGIKDNRLKQHVSRYIETCSKWLAEAQLFYGKGCQHYFVLQYYGRQSYVNGQSQLYDVMTMVPKSFEDKSSQKLLKTSKKMCQVYFKQAQSLLSLIRYYNGYQDTNQFDKTKQGLQQKIQKHDEKYEKQYSSCVVDKNLCNQWTSDRQSLQSLLNKNKHNAKALYLPRPSGTNFVPITTAWPYLYLCDNNNNPIQMETGKGASYKVLLMGPPAANLTEAALTTYNFKQ